MLGKELTIPAGAHRTMREDGDLVAVETSRARRARPADRARGRAARLARERARGQPDRHPRPFDPAGVPPRHAAPRRKRQGRRRSPRREDWRDVPFVTIDPPDAKDHDDAVHAEPDTAAQQSRRLHRHRRHRRRRPLRDARLGARPRGLVRGNSVYFPDRVVPMLPERISNDLCSLRAARGPRRARRAHGDRRRRPQALAHLPPRA